MDKPKFTLINGTQAPNDLKEQVRARLRTTKQPNIPQCPHCAGRTYTTVKTFTLKQNVCVFCMMNEKRLVTMF